MVEISGFSDLNFELQSQKVLTQFIALNQLKVSNKKFIKLDLKTSRKIQYAQKITKDCPRSAVNQAEDLENYEGYRIKQSQSQD